MMSVARLEFPFHPVSRRFGAGRWRRTRLGLGACWHAAELDRQLAAGAELSAAALLRTRAGRLIGRGNRTRVAHGLERVLHDAEAPGAALSPAAAPDRLEVRAARTVLAVLESRLRAPAPVTAQGMAMLQALLTDATSPLYRPAEPGALGSRLRAAAAALEPAAQVAVPTRESVSR